MLHRCYTKVAFRFDGPFLQNLRNSRSINTFHSHALSYKNRISFLRPYDSANRGHCLLFRSYFVEDCGDDRIDEVRRPQGERRRHQTRIDEHFAEPLEEDV